LLIATRRIVSPCPASGSDNSETLLNKIAAYAALLGGDAVVFRELFGTHWRRIVG
jgi:hypothetical protein